MVIDPGEPWCGTPGGAATDAAHAPGPSQNERGMPLFLGRALRVAPALRGERMVRQRLAGLGSLA